MEQLSVWDYLIDSHRPTRRIMTDAVQELHDTAKVQGSHNYKWLYTTYSRLVKAIAGECRLTKAKVELFIAECVKEGVDKDLHYKEVYEFAKRHVEIYIKLLEQERVVSKVIYNEGGIEITREYQEQDREYKYNTRIDGKYKKGLTFNVSEQSPVTDEYVINVILSQIYKAG